MDDQERAAMNASANHHSQLGSLAFKQGWEAAMRYMVVRERMSDPIEAVGFAIHQDMVARRRG